MLEASQKRKIEGRGRQKRKRREAEGKKNQNRIGKKKKGRKKSRQLDVQLRKVLSDSAAAPGTGR